MTRYAFTSIDQPRPGHMDDLLRLTVSLSASDMHLTYGEPPVFRVGGELTAMPCEPYNHEEIRALLEQAMPPRYKEVLEEKRSVDFAVSRSEIGRFRFAAYYQRGALTVAVRLLAKGIPDFTELNLPPSLARLASFRDGLVLVTGVTGSGKSTTLATIIDAINRTERKNIITIEDPIEYVHDNRLCIINQRELHTDVHTFSGALRDALRADPDVILVGEIRDLDTMRTAITAAETGHLVFSTLHSKDAMSSVNRMVGAFPAGEQAQVRQQLSSTLRAVICQRLMLSTDRKCRVPAVEVMFATSGISNLLRLAKDDMIYSAIETGQREGMQTMEQSLISLLEAGKIDVDTALSAARNRDIMTTRLNLRGFDQAGRCNTADAGPRLARLRTKNQGTGAPW